MTPEPESIEEELVKQLEGPLEVRGFKLKKIGFGKQAVFIAFALTDTRFEQCISPALVVDRATKVCRLNFHVTVRIYRILNFMRKYWHHLSDRDMQSAATCTKMISSVARFHSAEDVSPQLQEILSRLERDAFPFLQKWSSEEVLAQEIEMAVGTRRLTIPTPRSIDRAEILLAIYILRGDTDRFKKMVPILRKEVEKENGGYYLPTFEQIVSEMAADHKIAI